MIDASECGRESQLPELRACFLSGSDYPTPPSFQDYVGFVTKSAAERRPLESISGVLHGKRQNLRSHWLPMRVKKYLRNSSKVAWAREKSMPIKAIHTPTCPTATTIRRQGNS